ncbi:YidC/Oxa1 family membrane protein insertase [Streptomyces sp. NBC_00557]|uniref:YidC/Oxa1 family membrane protein insertase n=1 Tax=Streptomyces sp. NBC_00557 TaxID=2975776 RepID=UPI002E814654|nr:membrane protein insertase YidC [Streptomyces sp. NBC_00557]WUC36743.1 YidC/Oxa1 family membrane protein insertase [Streptomyces sp. NBC_00557]
MSVSPVFSVVAQLVERLAGLLQPLFHASAAAAAIVLFTALVRLLVHPLSRAAARGQRARAELQPRIAELRRKYAEDPRRLQQAVLELHAEERVSPLSGCLPGLLQMPAFFLLYHLFSSTTIGGAGNGLLAHRLFAAPLGGRWADALADGGVFGPAGLVYLGLFAVVAVVAAFNYRRAQRMTAENPVAAVGGGGERVPGLGAVTRAMPFLSFFTLVTVAVVPLAAALYVVTSTAWSAVERAVLYR